MMMVVMRRRDVLSELLLGNAARTVRVELRIERVRGLGRTAGFSHGLLELGLGQCAIAIAVELRE